MGLSKELSCEARSFSHHCNSHRFFQSEVLRLYFPALGPWVAWSVLLPSCFTRFILTQVWDCPIHYPPPRPVCQPPPCLPWLSSHCLSMSPLHSTFLSLPLLPVWMNVSSLTPWLLDFHAVQFSGSFDYFLFLNLLLSFFWLCEEAKYIYLCLHLG